MSDGRILFLRQEDFENVYRRLDELTARVDRLEQNQVFGSTGEFPAPAPATQEEWRAMNSVNRHFTFRERTAFLVGHRLAVRRRCQGCLSSEFCPEHDGDEAERDEFAALDGEPKGKP